MPHTAIHVIESRELYQALVVHSPHTYIVITPEGTILEANQAACDLFGYSKNEFLINSCIQVFDGPDLNFKQLMMRLSQQARVQLELTGIKKNGVRFPIEFSCVPFRNKNQEEMCCAVITDISDKKNYELELENLLQKTRTLHQTAENSRRLLASVLESITDGFFTIDAEATITYWNHAAEKVTGISKKEAIGKSLWKIFKDETPNLFRQKFSWAKVNKTAFHFEEYFPMLSAWLEINAYPSENGFSIFFKDISERKKAEDRIILNEEKLDLIYNTVDDVIFMLDIENEYRYKFKSVNKAFLKGTGLKREQIIDKYVEEVIPEPLLSLVLTKYAEAVNTRETVSWEEIIDYPIGTKTGIIKINPICNDDHKCIKLVGSVHDITDIREAEKALKVSNERYQYATRATNDAIYDWNILTGHIHWGIGFEKLFGFKRSEIYSNIQFWIENVHPEDKEAAVDSIMKTIADITQSQWQYEYRFRRADNTFAFVIEHGFIIRNEQNVPIRMVGAMQDISERKRAEEELRKLSLIARETVNAVIITNAAGEITWINAAFTKISGYSLSEVEGKKPGSFLQGQRSDPDTIRYMSQKIKNQEPFDCEIINYSKSDKEYWMKIQGQPLFNEYGRVTSFFALQTDITQQKEEELQLRLLETVITNAHDSIIIAEPGLEPDQKIKIIYTNDAFSKINGYLAEEVVGLQPGILFGPETSLTETAKFTQALEEWTACEVEILLYRKSGEKFWSHFSAIPIADKLGIFTHWIFIQRDITPRKKEEAERQLMIDRLTQTNNDLKQFSFITSHNLRAPLSNLIGLLNLIKPETITDSVTQLIMQKMRESTVQLNSVINDLMEVLIIKNNGTVGLQRLSLNSIFQEVVASVENLLNEADATLVTDFSGGDYVYFSQEYLRSILLNLLTNAIKYSSPERKLMISLKTEKKQNNLFLFFTDNGLGIDLNRHGDRIFGLYQRFHSNKNSKGMGLHITHTQVKAMGGNIMVTSEVNEGTTFTIQFKNID